MTATAEETLAVCATLYEFARGIDTRDWTLLESVFVPDMHYDYSSHRPGAEGPIAAADWVAARRKRFTTMAATQHTMTNPSVEVEGDRARCRMYVEAWHVAEVDGHEQWCTIGGEYRNDLVRVEGRWLISVLRLDRRWTVGNPAVLDLPVA